MLKITKIVFAYCCNNTVVHRNDIAAYVLRDHRRQRYTFVFRKRAIRVAWDLHSNATTILLPGKNECIFQNTNTNNIIIIECFKETETPNAYRGRKYEICETHSAIIPLIRHRLRGRIRVVNFLSQNKRQLFLKYTYIFLSFPFFLQTNTNYGVTNCLIAHRSSNPVFVFYESSRVYPKFFSGVSKMIFSCIKRFK